MNQDQLLTAIKLRIGNLIYGAKPLPFTHSLINTYLVYKGRKLFKYEVSDLVLGCQVIKLHDDWLKYVVVMPDDSYDDQSCEQFIWYIGPEFDEESNAVTPDQASMYLLNKIHPDVKIQNITDNDGNETTIMRMGDFKTVIKWPTGLTDHETWRKGDKHG